MENGAATNSISELRIVGVAKGKLSWPMAAQGDHVRVFRRSKEAEDKPVFFFLLFFRL